jgi:hypothetical protein
MYIPKEKIAKSGTRNDFPGTLPIQKLFVFV